jgi:hypothetical protein
MQNFQCLHNASISTVLAVSVEVANAISSVEGCPFCLDEPQEHLQKTTAIILPRCFYTCNSHIFRSIPYQWSHRRVLCFRHCCCNMKRKKKNIKIQNVLTNVFSCQYKACHALNTVLFIKLVHVYMRSNFIIRNTISKNK